MKQIVYLLLCLVFIVNSCNSDQSLSKKRYLKKFQSFIEAVEQDYPSFEKENWDKSDETFNELSKVDYKRFEVNLTEDENDEINRLIGKYNGFKFKGKSKIFIQEMDEKIEDATDRVNGFIEAITERDTLNNSQKE